MYNIWYYIDIATATRLRDFPEDGRDPPIENDANEYTDGE